MTELSPSTQAVLDAFDIGFATPRECLAAALRAAADEVALRWAELQHPSDTLNAIADELEAVPE
jgi:hypothetical protein